MTEDIVTRLRVWSTWLNERCPDTEVPNDLKEAADEIERLREALRVEQEELAACCIDRKETQRERDEARRLWCVEIGELYSSSALSLAKERGWDCFKEETRGND